MKPTYIDFFAGVGGFRLAFDAAGFRCVWTCEIDEKCGKVYAARFGHEPDGLDINKVTPDQIPDADIWVGGFPCQDLSVAGRRTGINKGERSGLIWKLLELATVKKPKWILLENVPGLLSGKDEDEEASDDPDGLVNGSGPAVQSWFGELLRAMADLWPCVGWRVLDAQYLGVPQRRRRVFLAGGPAEASVRAVLFEPESRRRDPAAGGQKKKIAAGKIARSLNGVGGGQDFGANNGTLVQADEKEIVPQAVSSKWAKGSSGPSGDEHHNLIIANSVQASEGHHGHRSPRGDGNDNLVVAGTLQSSDKDQGRKTQEVDQLVIAPTLTGGGDTEDSHGKKSGTDRMVVVCENGTDIQVQKDKAPCLRDPKAQTKNVIAFIGVTKEVAVALPLAFDTTQITSRDNRSNPKLGDPCHPLAAEAHPPAVAFEPGNLTQRCGSPPNEQLVPTLGSEKLGDTFPHVAQVAPAVEEHFSRTGNERTEAERLVAVPLSQRMRGQDDACADNVQAVAPMMIRRLSPSECERLQGFSDGHTCLCGVRPDCPDRRIPPWLDPKTFHLQGCGHSICGCKCPDGPRYRQMGNAVAVPVVRWIANRLILMM